MVSKDDGRQVIWPVYLDANVSRGDGRRVAAEWAVEDIDIHLIAKVAEVLELHPTLEEEARYPGELEVRGRVLVDHVQPKSKTIRIIAKRIKSGNY